MMKRNSLLRLKSHLDLCFAILPIGLFGGALLIHFLLPIAFPEQYTDDSIGPSAVELFMILLIGWCLTLLATPSYTALQAGKSVEIYVVHRICGCFWHIIGFLLIRFDGSFTNLGTLCCSNCINPILCFLTAVINSPSQTMGNSSATKNSFPPL